MCCQYPLSAATTEARTSPSSSPWIAGKLGIRDTSVCRIRNWISTPWDMASLIVLMMSGTADRGTALRDMSRWREPRDMATTLAFFVAQPMKTGFKSSSDCGPSAYL